MKNTKSLLCVVLLLSIFFQFEKTFSQKIASTSRSFSIFNKAIPEEGILQDGEYTYDYKKKTVKVEVKGDYYYEYFSNKEYIKAKIYWFTKYKYSLTLVDIQRKNYPLRIGDKLTARIEKIEGDKYYYVSNLNNKTRKGSFKKVRKK